MPERSLRGHSPSPRKAPVHCLSPWTRLFRTPPINGVTWCVASCDGLPSAAHPGSRSGRAVSHSSVRRPGFSVSLAAPVGAFLFPPSCWVRRVSLCFGLAFPRRLGGEHLFTGILASVQLSSVCLGLAPCPLFSHRGSNPPATSAPGGRGRRRSVPRTRPCPLPVPAPATQAGGRSRGAGLASRSC